MDIKWENSTHAPDEEAIWDKAISGQRDPYDKLLDSVPRRPTPRTSNR